MPLPFDDITQNKFKVTELTHYVNCQFSEFLCGGVMTAGFLKAQTLQQHM